MSIQNGTLSIGIWFPLEQSLHAELETLLVELLLYDQKIRYIYKKKNTSEQGHFDKSVSFAGNAKDYPCKRPS